MHLNMKVRFFILMPGFLLHLFCSNEKGIIDPTYWNKGFQGITFTNESG